MRDDNREYTVADKRFPVWRAVLLTALVFWQIFGIVYAVRYHPAPQDRIDEYELQVEPRTDGRLKIDYRFTWTPLDASEPLTWVEIGMANPNFEILSYSDNIRSAVKTTPYDEESGNTLVYTELTFKESHTAGETFSFSFTVLQGQMLTKLTDGDFFYSFVPGWFNATPISEYRFCWKENSEVLSHNADEKNANGYLWTGSMNPGDYVEMKVTYSATSFDPAVSTVKYTRFDDGGVQNALKEKQSEVRVSIIFLCIAGLFIELFLADAFVSYHRGSGFMTGYGYPIHVFGRSNPRYLNASKKHRSSGSHGSHGGGCACACACACAGGGRAGCSQKDTTEIKNKNERGE